MTKKKKELVECPYCGKAVKDMPDHLEKNLRGCHTQHRELLRLQLMDILLRSKP